MLLTADLNAPPDAIEVATLTDVMTDTWVAAGGAPDAATLSSDNPYAPLEAERQIDQRIDYLLARVAASRAVTATQAFTVHGPIDGVHPSDHAPVAVDLQLRPPQAESHRTVKEIP